MDMALIEKLEDFSETNYSREPLGPSSRSCAKVVFGNSCGSGSLVGTRNGKSLLLTNAHVAGSQPGRTGRVWFPFWDNQPKNAKIIMAAYSDRVMMDWAVLELDSLVPLPHIKLSLTAPSGEHYTGGYPRCQGPLFQRLVTRDIIHSGTVWRWNPNAIGGQSGSGVHSFTDHLQRGLLTWSWGGLGAGQTTRSIWLQYSTRGEIGFRRPEGLIELSDVNPELESGFFYESNITTLPIWHEISDGSPEQPKPDPSDPNCQDFAKMVLESAAKLEQEVAELKERARQYGASGSCDNPTQPDPSNPGTIFGL